MAFRVELTFAAQRDIEEAIEYIALNSPLRAKKWHLDFANLLRSLRDLPTRHALIPESEFLERALRSIRHHSHRVIYEVDEQNGTVIVVRVYHGARKPLEDRDL